MTETRPDACRHATIYSWLIFLTLLIVVMATMNWTYNLARHAESLVQRQGLAYELERQSREIQRALDEIARARGAKGKD